MSHPHKTPPNNSHVMEYRVCYADTDCMGRVYYSNYLVFFERSRTELLRSSGLPYGSMEEQGFFLPVRHCEVRYNGFAVYDDALEIHSWVSKLKHATVTFASGVRRKGEDQFLVRGTVELACIGADGRPKALPQNATDLLTEYLCD